MICLTFAHKLKTNPSMLNSLSLDDITKNRRLAYTQRKINKHRHANALEREDRVVMEKKKKTETRITDKNTKKSEKKNEKE